MANTDTQSSGAGSRSSANVVKLPKAARPEQQQRVSDFVRDHPLLVVAGGLAIGAVVAALLPKGTARRAARRAVALAEVASTAGLLLGSKVRDGAEATGAGLRERGGAVADRLEKLGGSASERLGELGSAASARVEKLIDQGEGAAAKVARKASQLRSRIRP